MLRLSTAWKSLWTALILDGVGRLFMSGLRHSLRLLVLSLLVAPAAGALTGCGGGEFPLNTGSGLTTSVAPLKGEDLAGPCVYDLSIFDASVPIRGVLVIFDRADSNQVAANAQVRGLAASMNFALLFPHQCNAASYGDIQVNAAKGPGRAMTSALNQLAIQTDHPELIYAPLVLYGFSAAGVLSATMANQMPSRVLGVVIFAGASPYVQLNQVTPTKAALSIPFLLLSSDADIAAGTSRDQMFFNAGWAAGAPWSWAVQHNVGHCCAASTIPIILPWIAGLGTQRLSSTGAIAAVNATAGQMNLFTCTPSGVWDVTGYQNCEFTYAAQGGAFPTQRPAGSAGWLPDQASAAAWLAWVTAQNGDSSFQVTE